MAGELAKLFATPMPMPNPLRQRDAGRYYDPFGNPIDNTRPVLRNPDGSVSTEVTSTEQFATPDGLRWLNFPTIVNGQRLPLGDAVAAVSQGRNPPVGNYADLATAEQAAQQRTHYLGILEAMGLLSDGGRNGR